MRKKMLLAAAFSLALAISAGAATPALDTLICHRGESHDAPENALPAYKMAVERGFGFECDIYLSKDGRVFTFHDSTLKRTSGGANTKACNEATWDEVSKLDVGSWGKWKGSKFAGARPALFEEVLELARDGRWIYVDVKARTGDIVPYVKAILEKQTKANPGNTLFLCGSVECGKEFKLGMEPGAAVRPAPPRKNGVTKPVVFYGTSITQGACASRPGMSFVNIVGRDLDVPVVNLGFSGSGVMELEMSEHLARIDASCYVLDCLWNMGTATGETANAAGGRRKGRNVEENYEPFIHNLRPLTSLGTYGRTISIEVHT